MHKRNNKMKFVLKLVAIAMLSVLSAQSAVEQRVQACKNVPTSVLVDIEHPLMTVVIKSQTSGKTSVAEFEKCNTEHINRSHISSMSRHMFLDNTKLKFNFENATDVNIISLYEGGAAENHASLLSPQQLGFVAALSPDPDKYREITDFKPSKAPVSTKNVTQREVPKGSKIVITRDNQITIKTPTPKLGSIAVYKKADADLTKKWKIQAVDSDYKEGQNPTTVFSSINIQRDTTGFARKLKYPKDRDWWLWIYKQGSPAPITTPMSWDISGKIILLNKDGKPVDGEGNIGLASPNNIPTYAKK
jgi:hypothetical protein